MGKRLNTERQEELEPKRMTFAKEQITNLGYEIIFENANEVQFMFKGHKVYYFPYSGWARGKTITDGRGINALLKQIKP